MLMTKGQIYRCQNRHCNCEITVTRASIEGSSTLRCCCGAIMKKPYSPPVLQELSSNVLVSHTADET
jgi:hypothetical protein